MYFYDKPLRKTFWWVRRQRRWWYVLVCFVKNMQDDISLALLKRFCSRPKCCGLWYRMRSHPPSPPPPFLSLSPLPHIGPFFCKEVSFNEFYSWKNGTSFNGQNVRCHLFVLEWKIRWKSFRSITIAFREWEDRNFLTVFRTALI